MSAGRDSCAAGFILSAIGYTELFHALPLQAFLFLVALGVLLDALLVRRLLVLAMSVHIGPKI